MYILIGISVRHALGNFKYLVEAYIFLNMAMY